MSKDLLTGTLDVNAILLAGGVSPSSRTADAGFPYITQYGSTVYIGIAMVYPH